MRAGNERNATRWYTRRRIASIGRLGALSQETLCVAGDLTRIVVRPAPAPTHLEVGRAVRPRAASAPAARLVRPIALQSRTRPGPSRLRAVISPRRRRSDSRGPFLDRWPFRWR